MLVKILKEDGYDEALLGMSLSYYDHAEPLDIWWNEEKKTRAAKRIESLAFKGGGHSKSLESLIVWIYIQAPRSFWSEFDTYRIGMTKQSSSTMHTLDKRFVGVDDFEEGTSIDTIVSFNNCLLKYRNENDPYYKNISILKNNLPEGFLQERQVTTNYKTLQEIYRQRHKHRLIYWKIFCETLKNSVKYPELIVPKE